MEEKEQSLLDVFIELQRLSNSGVIDALTSIVTRINECGKDVEAKNDAIREVLRPVYYNKATREFAITIGNNPDYLPNNFIDISGALTQLKEQLKRLLSAYAKVMPHKSEDTFEEVAIENFKEG